MQFPTRESWSRTTHTKSRSTHQHQEVQVRREKGASEAEASLGSPADSRANTSWKLPCTKLHYEYWHPPYCQFCQPETGRKFGAECSFPHWKVEEHPSKWPKKGGDKSAVTVVRSVRQLNCVSQDTGPPDSVTISRKSNKVLGPNRRVRFTRAALRHANIRESSSLAE